MDKPELKPCPFCGGKASIYRNWFDDTYSAQCCVCGNTTLRCFDRKTAVLRWNNRVGLDVKKK